MIRFISFYFNLSSKVFLAIALTLVVSLVSIPSSLAQKRKKVEIKRANSMKSIKRGEQTIRRLIGNVVIVHEGITMECDSAYEYTPTNIYDAFGNVVITQGKAKLYGEFLNYDGNLKQGRIFGQKVRLVEDNATLVTKSINFNTAQNSASYYSLGVITSSDGNFSSTKGTYYSNEKTFKFYGNAVFQDSSILLNTDSLDYFTETSLVNFFGPTRIYNDSSFLYCELGWFNKNTKESNFSKNVYLSNREQELYANNVYNNSIDSVMWAKGNALIIDTAQNTFLYGNSMHYWQNTKRAKIADNPLAVNISEENDTLFLRANELNAVTIFDSTGKESHKKLWAKGNVAFFRTDFQGKCDSMVFHSTDSTLQMLTEPVIWNEGNQLTAEYIVTTFRNGTIDLMEFKGFAFVCQEDFKDMRYNQVKGKEMIGFFTKGKLTRIDVTGNGESVYYVKDKEVTTSVNRGESSSITMSITGKTINSITLIEKPNAILYPLEKATKEDIVLKGFIWKDSIRPKSKLDIIPNNMNIKFYISRKEKAENFRKTKMFPATSIQ